MAKQKSSAGDMRIEWVPLSTVERWPKNPKLHADAVLDQSMDRFGYVAPMIRDELTGRLVAGHGRLDRLIARKAAKLPPPERIKVRRGEWLVPVVCGVRFASAEEAEAYLLADNQTTIAGGWGADIVPMLERLKASPRGFEGVGFSAADIEAFRSKLAPPAAGSDEGERSEGDEHLVVDVHDLRAPFPWFGGKSRAAGIVWGAFGDVPNYVEPFFGSGAVLLARPGGPGKIETVNDLDRWVANFWRAVSKDPDAVAAHADWPVNEADLHARHKWLLTRDEWKARMQDGDNPDFFDARIAGWWCWGLCAWIGSGWCAPKGDDPSEQVPHLSGSGQGLHGARIAEPLSGSADPGERLPHLGNAGRGVHRGRMSVDESERMPHLSKGPTGVHRERHAVDAPSEKLPMLAHGARGLHAVGLDAPSEQLPHLQAGSRGEHRASLGDEPCAVTANILAWMQQLRDRLRRVRVSCGSWERVLTPAVTTGHGLTGVMLDPPYAEGADDLYGNHDKNISAKVRAWAIEHGDDPLLRIAFCGYAGEHEAFPRGWRCVHWKAQGGYGSGNGNPYRERIWLSPHCLRPEQASA